jgi:Mitochondrial carrier protein
MPQSVTSVFWGETRYFSRRNISKMTSKEQEQAADTDPLSSMVAGFARTFLRYYFKFPIKLFRPQPFNTYGYIYRLRQRAKKDGLGWTRVARNEWQLITSRTLPLLLINGSIGAMLFTVYTGSVTSFKRYNDEVSTFWHYFTSGSIAGVFQALLATPLRDVESLIEARTISLSKSHTHEHRSHLQPARHPHELQHTHTSNTRNRPISALYKGLSLNIMRDSLAFSLFFGVFESTQHLCTPHISSIAGKETHLVPWIETGVLVSSGALGGLAFQLVNHPFARLNTIKQAPTPRDAVAEIRIRGLLYFYKGIAGQLMRVVPPSAIALCLYKVF